MRFGRLSAAFVSSALVAAVPAATPRAEGAPPPEFGGADADALVRRERVATPCTIDWVAKDGRRYCFSSAEGKAQFLKAPDDNIRIATDMYAAGDVHSVGEAMEKFTSDDAAALIAAKVKAASDAAGGVYVIDDPVTATSIPLVYDGIDFTRTLKGYGFFPDVKFHAKDDAKKKYLVDFWVVPRDGQLAIEERRIYKAPIKDGNDWVMMQRQPKPWWWIPAAEHPGETEEKRSWEVMSSISKYVLTQARANHGVFELKDDKTGETIPLDFLYVHQPVRRLKANGRYFACTDFRKDGTTDQFYDIDFWLDAKTGAVTVDKVQVHKVPELRDGSFVQIPRYNFDPKTYDQVP